MKILVYMKRLLLTRMVVNWDGNVPVCVNDIEGKHNIGSLNVSTIEEIWNNDKIKDIRKIHKEGDLEKLPLCSSCGVLMS